MYDIYQTKPIVKVCDYYLRATQQFNGREGETATLLSTGLFTLNLCSGGFAPRHLSRYVSASKQEDLDLILFNVLLSARAMSRNLTAGGCNRQK